MRPRGRKGWVVSKISRFFLACVLAAPLANAQKVEEEILSRAVWALQNAADVPEGIPPPILNKAECVIVFPSVKTFGFGSGTASARGALTCRTAPDFTGAWGTPAMFVLDSGPVQFKFVEQETDLIVLVMSPEGAESVLKANLVLKFESAGKGREAAPGPSVRELSREAGTARADFLVYRRSGDSMLGASLEGCVLRADTGANRKVYGSRPMTKQIVFQNVVPPTASGRKIADFLNQRSPKNLSK